MDNLKLGEILESEEYRDAIHIAVAPVIAAEKLSPGEHVGIDDAGNAAAVDVTIGIVDPFLKKPVRKGQRFYLFLYPGTITSLRHEWIHPAFNGPQPPMPLDEKAVATSRMKSIAEYMGRSLGEMLVDAAAMAKGEYVNDGQLFRDKWDEIDREQFWKDYETLTGKHVDKEDAGGFTCSC